jgi:hypothetical protein
MSAQLVIYGSPSVTLEERMKVRDLLTSALWNLGCDSKRVLFIADPGTEDCDPPLRGRLTGMLPQCALVEAGDVIGKIFSDRLGFIIYDKDEGVVFSRCAVIPGMLEASTEDLRASA